MQYDVPNPTLPRAIQLLPVLVLGFALAAGVLVANGLRVLPRIAQPAPDEHAAPGTLAPVFAPSVLYWEREIKTWAAEWGLDPNLVATVMQIESCGDPDAVSGAGAQGLFQVMPFHFEAGEVMLDPSTNARRGMAYLTDGLALADGDVRLALAGYNGGHSQIGRNPEFWPEETQRYAYWGSGIYADIAAGSTASPTLTAWMAAGGDSLCASASERLGL